MGVAPGSSDRPLVIAHRGASAAEPEHTLAAYLRAIDDGVDGVECDVRLTRDGHLVCLHDRRLDRVSDGRGVVSEHTLADLDRLDFGVAHRRLPGATDDPILDRADVPAQRLRSRVLTLESLVRTLLEVGRPLRLLIETKHPNRFGSEVEQRLVAQLRRFGLDRRRPESTVHVTVMSFSALAVRRMRALAPLLPTVMLLELAPPGLRGGRLPFGAGIAGPGVTLLRAVPDLASRLKARGKGIYVWTVNTSEDLDVVLEAGVDAVISDRPAYVRAELSRRGILPAGTVA